MIKSRHDEKPAIFEWDTTIRTNTSLTMCLEHFLTKELSTERKHAFFGSFLGDRVDMTNGWWIGPRGEKVRQQLRQFVEKHRETHAVAFIAVSGLRSVALATIDQWLPPDLYGVAVIVALEASQTERTQSNTVTLLGRSPVSQHSSGAGDNVAATASADSVVPPLTFNALVTVAMEFSMCNSALFLEFARKHRSVDVRAGVEADNGIEILHSLSDCLRHRSSNY